MEANPGGAPCNVLACRAPSIQTGVSLWSDLDRTKEQVLYETAHCDILKISDNEIRWLPEKADFDTGIPRKRTSTH